MKQKRASYFPLKYSSRLTAGTGSLQGTQTFAHTHAKEEVGNQVKVECPKVSVGKTFPIVRRKHSEDRLEAFCPLTDSIVCA